MTTITEHTQTESQTTHRVTTQSPSGEYRRFLRTLVQTYDRLKYTDRWAACAWFHEGGRLQFCRSLRGEVGQPDHHVRVQTDVTVTTHYTVGSRSDKGFPLMPSSSIHVDDANTRLLAQLLLAHPTATLHINADHGSQNTEVLAMTFYHFCVHVPGVGVIRIGNDTIAQDTRVLTTGPVLLRR